MKETVAHLPNRGLIETHRVQHATCCTTQLCRPFSLPSFYQPRYHTFEGEKKPETYTPLIHIHNFLAIAHFFL